MPRSVGVAGTGVCVCRAASSGAGCEQIELGLSARDCPNFCSGHGLCREHGCACEAGYGGHDCGVACRDECSGNGVCDEGGGCSCSSGYFGPSCAEASPCPNGCSGRGLCRANATSSSGAHACFCQQGWTGAADCSVQDLECPHGCSGHGNCHNGTCECFAGAPSPSPLPILAPVSPSRFAPGDPRLRPMPLPRSTPPVPSS